MIFVVKSSVNTGPFLPNPTGDRFHGIKVYDAKEPDENIKVREKQKHLAGK